MSSSHHHTDQPHQSRVPRNFQQAWPPRLNFDIWDLVIELVEDKKQFRLVNAANHGMVDRLSRKRFEDAFYKNLAHDRDPHHLDQMTRHDPIIHYSYLLQGRHELVINYGEEDSTILRQFVKHCRDLASSNHAQGQATSVGSAQGHHHEQASSHQSTNPQTKLAYIFVNLSHSNLYKKLMTEYIDDGRNHRIKLVPQLAPDCADISPKENETAKAVYEAIIQPALRHSRQLILNHSDRRQKTNKTALVGRKATKEESFLAQCLNDFSESKLRSEIHTLVLEDYPSIRNLLWLSHFPELRVLSLSGAVLTDAASAALSNLSLLESLSLDRCDLKLKRIFWHQLSLPVSLRQLSLEGNELTDEVDIERDGVFQYTRHLFPYLKKLTNLESLNLKSNDIETLHDLCISLDKLAHIDITYNSEFTDFPGIADFRKVKLLACSGTNTDTFSSLFAGVRSEEEYDHIESFVFQAGEAADPDFALLSKFTGLKILDIGHASIVTFLDATIASGQTVHFSKMPHVHTLKLRKSKFRDGTTKLQGLKEKFPVLRHLDLHDCGLRMVHLVASELAGLRDLNISDNPLTADHHDKSKCSQNIYNLLSAITTLETVHHASCGLIAPAKDFKSRVHFVEDDPGAHSRHT